METIELNSTVELANTNRSRRNVRHSVVSEVPNPSENTPVPTFYHRFLQSFLLVWLDIDQNDSNHEVLELTKIANAVIKFSDMDECMDFVTDIQDQHIFLVLSGESSQTVIPFIHNIVQISSIYILCSNEPNQGEWIEQWTKIKGIFPDIMSICAVLKPAAHQYDYNVIPMSFIPVKDGIAIENIHQLDPSFMYTQFLKEILLSVDLQDHFQEFIRYYREQSSDNATVMSSIDPLERKYYDREPIWWYTSHAFLYQKTNQALRNMEIDLILKLDFFICDLHCNIEKFHSEQYTNRQTAKPFVVYRGQGLSHDDFEKLKNSEGGLISFNSFLSTSTDRKISLIFAESNLADTNSVAILFQINVDPSISSAVFANLAGIGRYEEEAEILFSMHSIFRVDKTTPIGDSNRFWEVDLSSTSDNDPQLQTLTNYIREELYPEEKGCHRLIFLLFRLGELER